MSLAGSGLPGDSLMVLQNLAIRRPYVRSEELLQREIVVLRRAYAAVRAGDSVALHTEVRNLFDVQVNSMGGAPAGSFDRENVANGAVRQLWSPWFRFFLGHDPAPDLRRIRCPVLALNGDRDVQVVAKENLGGIENALRAGGNKDVTLLSLPGLNHLFQVCKTCAIGEYGSLEETFAPSALDVVSTWIRKRTGLEKR